jgi:hypothetical protein
VAFDEMITRYGETADSFLSAQVLFSLFFRAGGLTELGRTDEAIVGLQEVITRYGDTTDPNLAVMVSLAKEALDELVEP